MMKAGLGTTRATVAVALSGLLCVSHAARLSAQALQARAGRAPARAAQLLAQLYPASESAAARERPGCAIGVDRDGEPRAFTAYGAADLEYGLPATPQTIYEAGSISKQFTASAVMLLALDGKLNLADDARRYVPELPVYERPITIDLLLHHTSGLRDWGDIAAMAGWPRGSRAHTNAHVLDIVSRQHALNYPPGDKYSYTNSGYNLLAIIVQRVSGQSLAQFTHDRLFQPLGMTHTGWRDDYTRIVRGRAQAYSPRDSGWSLDMPFEDAYGNGGLLITVDDLLTWMQQLEHPSPRFKSMVDSLHVQGRLTDGSTISYAHGLFIDDYRGLPRVQHSGATAGYRTFAERFPGKGVAIAVLCNAANANPGAIVNTIADSLLASQLAPRARAATSGAAAPATAPANANAAANAAANATANATANARAARPAWKPDSIVLPAYAGTYQSDEAEASYAVAFAGGQLWLEQRPVRRVALVPIAPDSFTVAGSGARYWFTRNAAGKVSALHVYSSRAWDVVFARRE